ncbi:MAG: NAD(P)/FAD-dependent oxidoreductase [Acidimicrobiales bacterium]
MTGPDIVVIGGGIAGASAAFALSRHPSGPTVTVVEADTGLTRHTTGRSAAILIENYGTPPLKALTRASLPFLTDPPTGLADDPLLAPRGMLSVAGPDQDDAFEQLLADGLAISATVREIDGAGAATLFPPLRPELVHRALHDPEPADIDVAALHQAFVRATVAAGGSFATRHRAVALERRRGRWRITIDTGPTVGPPAGPADAATLEADLVVDAAGAWGDEVATRAGVVPLGLRPLRRTAFMVTARSDVPPHAPLVADVEHSWYVKPDGPQLLCSPADETPSDPCDAKPEEVDIARAIDAINAATTLDIRTVRSSWAGLRTFSPDRTMVIGPDPTEPSFVWCVGQGGTGIQTSPAAGQLVADLSLDGSPGPLFDRTGTSAAVDLLRPDRFGGR